jgi:predicted GTPase
MKPMLSYLLLMLKRELLMDDVARLLRKVTKPVLLAVNNKVDNAMREKDAIEFTTLV